MSVDSENSSQTEQTEQTEMKSQYRKLARQKSALEKDLLDCESEENEIRARWQRLRETTLNRVEHLVMMMLPDSSETTIRKLAQIFPDEPAFPKYIPATQTESIENPENISAQMFGNSFGSLREIKKTLRDVLLKTNQIPRNINEFGSFYQVFLNDKNIFYAQDDLLLENQLQKHRVSQQIKAITEQMDAANSKPEINDSNNK